MKNTIFCALLASLLLLLGGLPGHAGTSASAAPAGAVFAETKLIDINSATDSELQSLSGIGPKTAAKIISGRPYKAKDELLDRKIVNKGQYAKIKDLIIAKQPKK
jgi:competence protein ComEA